MNKQQPKSKPNPTPIKGEIKNHIQPTEKRRLPICSNIPTPPTIPETQKERS